MFSPSPSSSSSLLVPTLPIHRIQHILNHITPHSDTYYPYPSLSSSLTTSPSSSSSSSVPSLPPSSTSLLHSDSPSPSPSPSPYPDVSPPLHFSTTFRSSNPHHLIYARESTPTRSRVEKVLRSIEYPYNGQALTFSSGLAAVQCVMSTVMPKYFYMEAGYHGVHDIVKGYEKMVNGNNNKNNFNFYVLSLSDLESNRYGQCDLIWLESPSNPFCSLKDINYFIHLKRTLYPNCIICVDGTIASPIGISPLGLNGILNSPNVYDVSGLKSEDVGVDIVMHSSTKYMGGHSDIMGGVLVVNKRHCGEEGQEGESKSMFDNVKKQHDDSDNNNNNNNNNNNSGGNSHLSPPPSSSSSSSSSPSSHHHPLSTSPLLSRLHFNRTITGAVPSPFDSWLLLRSLRTLKLRYLQQVKTTERVLEMLQKYQGDSHRNVIQAIHHPYIPSSPSYPLRHYLHHPPPTFSIQFSSQRSALLFQSSLRYFTPATSLGGVESLTDWRYLYDTTMPKGLVRVSVGVEETEDIVKDMEQAIKKVEDDEKEWVGKKGKVNAEGK